MEPGLSSTSPMTGPAAAAQPTGGESIPQSKTGDSVFMVADVKGTRVFIFAVTAGVYP
jgi:hypothetical protein